ncbi:glycoside hydrolase family 5 protein [Thermothelomyces heterothallicus CBS 202.75]|uniref:glycoside hydrolase family 5 protein n=1 Tax=Thermothelomyces heterothallicus CBS 202.75 TaxID=1149848 RepID=UPI0037429695
MARDPPSATRRSRSRHPDPDRDRDGYREQRRHRRHSSSTADGSQHQRRTKRRPASTPRAGVAGVAAEYHASEEEGGSSPSQVLSAAALARLNRENAAAARGGGRRGEGERARGRERQGIAREAEAERERERELRRERRREREREQERERARQKDRSRGYEIVEVSPTRGHWKSGGREAGGTRRRVVSGPALEEGRSGGGSGGGGGKGWGALRGGWRGSQDSVTLEKEALWKGKKVPWYQQKKKLWILIGVCSVLLIIVIIVAAVVVPKAGSGEEKRDDKSSESSDGNLAGISPDSIPEGAPSWLNPFVWQDTTDFNLTYTDEMVGDLPVMGLNTDWDDSARANENVPALDEPWGDYAKRPARGVNIGGWLSLEPFITPSLFEYDLRMGIVDEYTLCKYLGRRCESVLEKHYATFVTEDTFREIRDAGLDHVRIPFSYWAVQTYEGDPYLFRTSWRYLLRAIEWCRRYGLRVNLDLHGLPGSQNGWNHSGRLGAIGWLNGTNGDVNARRSLEIHDRLSKFFAQPRYRNIISHYGLANEPRMTFLDTGKVLQWTADAYALVRRNGVSDAVVVFGDGFRGLGNWQGELTGLDRAALDVHQYVIFNTNQIVFNHSEKVRYACEGWTEQTLESMDRATGFGPTLIAEWSQADTDCARHLTNVGWGNRWTGTYVTPDGSGDVTTPRCPTMDSSCSCDQANSPASQWSDPYKRFLKLFAEAQMSSFEKGWGWFYWVWDTEDAPQWSYKKGLAAGVLPAKAYERDFDCDLSKIPSFSDLPEYY